MEQKLVIVGAGPKGLAICAKLVAICMCQDTSLSLVVVDKGSVANHWDGAAGYTDGRQPLGTPPTKDLGFPYRGGFGPAVNRFMWNNFSWPTYLVHDADYPGNVDRGSPQPTHADWAAYLRWAWRRIEILAASSVSIELVRDEVKGIVRQGSQWLVTCSGRQLPIDCNGVVITGPGEPKLIPGTIEHPRWFDGKNVWLNLDKLKNLGEDAAIGVIGSGETAAAIIATLVEKVEHAGPINVFTKRATLYSRGESFFENALYTDPEAENIEWRRLLPRVRSEFIERTDRSVLSVHAMDVLRGARKVEPVLATYARWFDLGDEIELVGPRSTESADDKSVRVAYAINALGFNEWWFARLFTASEKSLLDSETYRRQIFSTIEDDLSVHSRYLKAKLHIPMLSAFSCGPGFPNLSCLGAMADRVLSTYVEPRTSRTNVVAFPQRR